MYFIFYLTAIEFRCNFVLYSMSLLYNENMDTKKNPGRLSLHMLNFNISTQTSCKQATSII